MGTVMECFGGAPKYLVRRIIICLAGAFIYACGVCMITRCDLGITPITSVPYTINHIVGGTLGIWTFCVNAGLIVFQKIVLKKEYSMRTLLFQTALSIVFSLFIDLAMLLFGGFQPAAYFERLFYLLAGCAVMSFGMCLVVSSKLTTLPGEGAAISIGRLTGLSFGASKILFDSAMVALAVTTSLVFIGNVPGVREGTLICAIGTGALSKLYMKWLNTFLPEVINEGR